MNTITLIQDVDGPRGPRAVDVEVAPNTVLGFDAQGAPAAVAPTTGITPASIGAETPAGAQAKAAAAVAGHNSDPAAHGDGLDVLVLTHIPAPAIPDVAVAGVGTLTGAYKWQISAYTAEGDSGFSPLSSELTLSSNSATVTLPVHSDERVVGWHIYRSKVGDTSRTYLSGTVLNGTTSYVDDVADSSLGADSHYLQTDTGYTCQGIKVGEFPAFTLQGLNLFLGEHAGDEVVKPAQQGMDNLYSMGLGSSALRNVIAGGGYNLAIGGGALQSLTHGGQNLAVGHKAGNLSDWHTGCTFIGTLAGEHNTRSDNTFVGGNAGQANVTGEDNTLIGKDTATGNFSRTVVLGKGASATADDQFMVKAKSMELSDAGASVVLRSPNGNRYKITVSDAGALVVTTA